MKFEMTNDKIIVYIFDNKYFKENKEDIVKNVFEILTKYYTIELKKAYYLKLYINKYYGMILEILEDKELSKDNIVNLNLRILNDTLFLYEIEDPLNYINEEIYYYDDKYYLNIKKNDIKLIENTNMIYSDDVYKIIGKGIKI